MIKDHEIKSLYGFKKNNNYIIHDVSYEKNGVTYKIGEDEIRLKVFGNHNILNSAACYLIGKELKISDEGFNESIKTFRGVKRRLELKLDNKIKIYDDYAHHPTEVRATLDTLKRNNKGRIITVFQPHLYSRTKDFYKEFGQAFLQTDILVLAKIYPAREKEIEGVSSQLILNEYNTVSNQGFYYEDNEQILDELERIKRDGDIIVFQGAGDITELCDKFIKRIKTKTKGNVPL